MIKSKRACAVMLATSARGGIRSVVESYENDGVFERWNVRLIVTHVDGSTPARVRVFLESMFRLIFALMTRRVVLVHCHSASRGSFVRKAILASIARFFRVPTILHLHGGKMKDFYARSPKLLKRFVVSQLRKASVVVVLTESWQKFIHTIAPDSNVVVLPNYVTPPKVVDYEQAKPVVQILFLGLIAEGKGIYDLLSAFQIAVEHVPSLRLIIGGDGEIEKAKIVTDKLGITNKVEFRGWIAGQEKDLALRTSDIFVLPSHDEGLPISVLEGMAWGLAVIATNVGGVPDVVLDEVDGLLISPGDVKSLAVKLVRLGKDPAMRNALAKAGRSRVERAFSPAIVLSRLHNLYQHTVANRTSPPVPRARSRDSGRRNDDPT